MGGMVVHREEGGDLQGKMGEKGSVVGVDWSPHDRSRGCRRYATSPALASSGSRP